MAKKKKHPKVLLVGRTNVGKSTLFNRLSSTTKSIVYDRPGVTRDYIHELVEWDNKTFDLIDTGGITMTKHKDVIQHEITDSVKHLFDDAALVLFVCDVKNGLVEEDRLISRMLHRLKKPTILILNKADNKRAYEENNVEFHALGFDTILPISASHGTGIATLLEKIIQFVPEQITAEEEIPEYNIVIIGKPNVGKSSLLNLLLKRERAIVSDIAGTTRESITEQLHFFKDTIQITDTAGIRRKKKISDDLESLMVRSSFKSVREADIVLLVIDASQGCIADQELKLLFFAFEQKKAIIVLFNKIDLHDDISIVTLENQLDEYDFIFKKIEKIEISCETKKNVGSIFKIIKKVWLRLQQDFNSTELNDYIQELIQKKPMYHKRQQIKLFKIRHVKARTPTFVLHVNRPEWFGSSQLGFIENCIRKKYDLVGCPINFLVRGIGSRNS